MIMPELSIDLVPCLQAETAGSAFLGQYALSSIHRAASMCGRDLARAMSPDDDKEEDGDAVLGTPPDQ